VEINNSASSSERLTWNGRKRPAAGVPMEQFDRIPVSSEMEEPK